MSQIPPGSSYAEPESLITDINAALKQCAAGTKDDQQRFFELLWQFRPRLLRRFPGKSRRRWFDPEDAVKDALIEVYTQAIEGRLKTPPENNDWHGLLYRAARKQFWSHLRKDKKELPPEAAQVALIQAESSPADDPVGPLETKETLESLMEKVSKALSPLERTVFSARAQGIGYQEIARSIGTSVGAARGSQSRAKKKMAKFRKVNADQTVA